MPLPFTIGLIFLIIRIYVRIRLQASRLWVGDYLLILAWPLSMVSAIGDIYVWSQGGWDQQIIYDLVGTMPHFNEIFPDPVKRTRILKVMNFFICFLYFLFY